MRGLNLGRHCSSFYEVHPNHQLLFRKEYHSVLSERIEFVLFFISSIESPFVTELFSISSNNGIFFNIQHLTNGLFTSL